MPKSDHEQRAIATALSDVDALLDGLERFIAKKRDLKRALMQQLLSGQTRLPGFQGTWETKTLKQSADCLDSVRVPLNEAQRAKMKGDYPYCGANGVLDYVNGYVIDDDIILMAEDGGYFDEYNTRPIAYRMRRQVLGQQSRPHPEGEDWFRPRLPVLLPRSQEHSPVLSERNTG